MDRKRQTESDERRSRSQERLLMPSPRIRHSPRLREHNSDTRLSRRGSSGPDRRSPQCTSRRPSVGSRSRLSPRRPSRRPSPKPNRRRHSPVRQSSPGRRSSAGPSRLFSPVRHSSPGPSRSSGVKHEESPVTRTITNNRCEIPKDKCSENSRFDVSDLKNIKLKVQNFEKSVIIVRRRGEGTKPIFDREEIKNSDKKYDEEIETRSSFLDGRIDEDRIRLRENDGSRSPLVRRREQDRDRDRDRERDGERDRDIDRRRRRDPSNDRGRRSRSRSRSRGRGRRSPRNHTVSPNRERHRGDDRRYASADRVRDGERRSRERSPRRERPYEVGPPIIVPHPRPLPPHFVPAPVYWGYPRPVRPILRPMGPPFPRYVRGLHPEFVRLPPPPHAFVRVPPPHIRPPRY